MSQDAGLFELPARDVCAMLAADKVSRMSAEQFYLHVRPWEAKAEQDVSADKQGKARGRK